MAEFKVVAKEIERLCKTYQDKCRTDECPLYLEDLCYARSMSNIYGDEAGKLEDTVMVWAAEHPGPIFPSWLEAMGWGKLQWCEVRAILAKPMDSENAKKLGIVPKEE